MNPPERVGIAELKVALAPQVLVCYGLGSCLGIAIYDLEAGCGGLAHCLLPQAPDGGAPVKPGKFVDIAIPQLVRELAALGGEPRRLQAKLCGGAAMFRSDRGGELSRIGVRNRLAALEQLEQLQIPLVAEETGADYGRTMELDLGSGMIQVRSVRGHDKLKQI